MHGHNPLLYHLGQTAQLQETLVRPQIFSQINPMMLLKGNNKVPYLLVLSVAQVRNQDRDLALLKHRDDRLMEASLPKVNPNINHRLLTKYLLFGLIPKTMVMVPTALLMRPEMVFKLRNKVKLLVITQELKDPIHTRPQKVRKLVLATPPMKMDITHKEIIYLLPHQSQKQF